MNQGIYEELVTQLVEIKLSKLEQHGVTFKRCIKHRVVRR